MEKSNQVQLLEKQINKLEKENLILQEKVDFLTRKLYGNKSDRLYLHAESIEFLHPATGERKKIVVVDHSVYAK